ncbi:MAG: barstar family protein [Burkholderiaceae bacterium]
MSAQKPTRQPSLPAHAMRSLRGIDVDRLRESTRASGRQLVEVDLSGCDDRTAAMHAISSAFALPHWFGSNLDALYDALTDLGERGGAGVVVLLEHVPQASRVFSEEQRRDLLQVFRDAVRHHKLSGFPLSVYYS